MEEELGYYVSKPKNIPFKDKDKINKEVIALIDKYDADVLSYIARLYEALNGEKLDFTKVKSAVDALAIFNKKQEYNYLNNLLHPECSKGCKIPSPIPIPSCAFQLHNCVTLSTNSSGNLGLVFNPFFLASNQVSNIKQQITNPDNSDNSGYLSPQTLSTLWINNDNSLTGSLPNENWTSVNIGQTIPGVYDQFRLVSASLVIKYIGRMDIVSGVIGGAIVFDENQYIGGSVNFIAANGTTVTATDSPLNPDLAKYGNFDLAMDSFYHQENLCLEGIRELYFPIDNSFEEYTRVTDGTNIDVAGTFQDGILTNAYITGQQDYYKSGFNWMVYVLGAPVNSACFKVDIYCNYECLPNASFLNYLPLSMAPGVISSEQKKEANLIVQQKPVMALKETNAIIPKVPSIWEKMKQKFANSLPGISKLIAQGIVNAIPTLKPGLALAGTMINAVANSGNGNGTMQEDIE